MKAKTIKGTSTAEIAEGINESITEEFKPTLAIVFLSIKQDWKAISQLLNDRQIDIFGATTAGEFIDGEVGEGTAVIMLLNTDKSLYQLFYQETGNSSTFELSKCMGQTGLSAFAESAFIVASGGLSTNGEMIVRGIESVVGEEATIFGGLAGDDFTMTGTYVFTNGQSSDNAVVAIIFDGEKVSVKGTVACGWKPVGTVRTITKSEGNVVYTIDNQPALDVIIKYMGIAKDIDEWKDVIMNVGSEFPMQLQRDNAPPVMRAPLYANKSDRSLICAGSVPQGAKVRFSLPPDFDIIDKVVSECKEVKNLYQPEADAMIMFSCKARHSSLGPLIGEEIDGVKEVWQSPMIGFFSYGEMGKSAQWKHEFHNNTCSLVVLKEI